MATPFPGMDPSFLEDLKKIAASMGPSDEDAKAALRHSLLTAGLGMLGSSYLPPTMAAGRGGLLGVQSYNDEIKQMQAQRAANLSAAAQTYKLGKDAAMTQWGMNMVNEPDAPQSLIPGTGAPSMPPSSFGAQGMAPGGAAGLMGGAQQPGPGLPPVNLPQMGAGGSPFPTWRQTVPKEQIAGAVISGDWKKFADVVGEGNKITVGKNGEIYKGNMLVARARDTGTEIYPNGDVSRAYFVNSPPEALVSIAAQAGAVKGAETAATEKAKFPYQMGERMTPGNVKQTGFLSDLYGQPNISDNAPAAAPSVGRGLSVSSLPQLVAADRAGQGATFTRPATPAEMRLAPLSRIASGANPVEQATAMAEGTTSGKNLAEQALGVDTEARAAQNVFARSQEIRNLATMVRTNAGAPARMEVAKWADAAGLPQDTVNAIAGGSLPAMQALGKQAVQGAFEAARQALGTGQRITQSEVLTMAQNSPSVAMTPQAINAMLDFQEGVAKWQVDKQSGKDEWIHEHGTYAGFENTWNKEHPLSAYVPSRAKLEAAIFPDGMPKPGSAAAPAQPGNKVGGYDVQLLVDEARRRGLVK